MNRLRSASQRSSLLRLVPLCPAHSRAPWIFYCAKRKNNVPAGAEMVALWLVPSLMEMG